MTLEVSAGGADLAQRRPFGVYVIALLQVLNAISHGSGVIAGVEDPVVNTLGGFASASLALLFSLAGFAVAVGLLLLKRVAWVATMLWVGVVMALELSLYLRGDDANYAVMAVSIAQVFYLNLADVQRAFAANSWDKQPP